jgi:WXG100 family type VII secretion target
MAGAVGLDKAAIEKVAGDMDTSITNIRSHIQKIEDAADAAKAGWHGDANASFVKAANSWHEEAETLKANLAALHQAVIDGKNKLLSMDAGNA